MNKPSSEIFTFPEVRVVEASAGSGKTFALAKRYLQLLLNPQADVRQLPIRHILALTFTNKAAFEMKERILEYLKLLASGEITAWLEDEILKPIGVDKASAAVKAGLIMEQIIHHYNFFQVQTIDKFINALLSGCAFKIGLTANFRIKTNSREYLERSLDELIEAAKRDKNLRRSFEEFLHHYLYLENRTGWFPKRDILAIVGTLFKQSNYYGLTYKEPTTTSEEVVKLKRSVLKDIKDLKEILPEDTHKSFENSLNNFLDKNVSGFDTESLSTYFAREELPVRKGGKIPSAVSKLWEKIRTAISELCHKESENLFSPYVQIYLKVESYLKNLAAKDDVLFLEQLNKKAAQLFDDDYVTVEELYYRLATRFHHYLIDEFQDTSRLQWHNLEKMAEEALSTGGSLFYVGDKKQAIYGFRGGEVGLFEAIKDEFSHFNVISQKLTKNWRSQKAVVEFNNTVFSADNLKQFLGTLEEHNLKSDKKAPVTFSDDDAGAIASIYENTLQGVKENCDGGYVCFEFIDADNKPERDEAIKEKVIACVHELKERYAFRDIAILTRGNRDIEELTSWLLEEGFPVESERTSNVKENALIKEIVAFLKFLESPIDNLAFADFILGDIFQKASGLKAEELHDFIFSRRDVIRAAKDNYLYMEFRAAYEKQWAGFIEEFFKNVGLYPLYELVVSIYYRLDCLKNFPKAQGYLMHVLEIIKNAEEDFPDLASFLSHFEELEGEELFVKVVDIDAIRLLTIHKAKGLEFPVVILPFLGIDVQVGSSADDNQQSFVLKKEDERIVLLKLKKNCLIFNDYLYQVHAEEYKKALLSELNNTYVALTRAKEELYGFIPKKVGASLNLVKYLLPENCYQSGHQLLKKAVEAKKSKDVIMKLPASQCHDWIAYLKDEFLSEEELANRENRRRGELIHAIFSHIGSIKEGHADIVVKDALEKAALYYPYVDDWKDLGQLVLNVLQSKTLGKFFYAPDAQVLNETEIVNKFGQTKRIDRLIINKDAVWVIDYKSSRDETGKDIKQVKEYVELVSMLYAKNVKGFIIYLDNLSVEEV